MQVKNTFLKSKLNTDLDERLVENTEMVNAENIRVLSSEGSDSGVLETIQGNLKLTELNLTNAYVIGAEADWSNRLIYFCVTSDEKDLVVEYDERNKLIHILAEGVRVDGKTWINFSRYNRISSIRKIINDDSDKDLLIFTDNLNNIRCLNIKRGKQGLIKTEEDWQLLKRPPRYALRTEMTYSNSSSENNLEGKFLAFAYRYIYEDGEISALSSFTNYKFQPSKFEIDYETMENKGMINRFNAINLYYNTGNYLVKEIEIVFKSSTSNAVYLIERINKEDKGLPNDSEQLFKFSNNKIYAQLNDKQLYRSYDNVPRKAKTLSLAQNRIAVANYTEGYNMIDKDGQKVIMDYNVSLKSEELNDIDITNEHPVGISFKIPNNYLTYNSKLSFDFSVYDKETASPQYSNVYSEFILNKEYSTLAELLSSEDFTHYLTVILPNAIMSNINNIESLPEAYSILKVNPISFTNDGQVVVLNEPVIRIKYPTNPNSSNTSYREKDVVLGYSNPIVMYNSVSVNTSLKTLRSYEVGVLYLDKDSRSTPTLDCATNTQFIPIEKALNRNSLQIEMFNKAPSFADRYKFVVKQSKGDYETIYINRFYQDGIYRWAALEGANKDKVKEGDTLIVKSDLGGPLESEIKVRVLEVTRNLEDFIKENLNVEERDIIEPAGLYIKIKPTGFDMNYRTGTTKSHEGSSHLRYPVKTYTAPIFGEMIDGEFVPFKLGAGSTVKMYINIKARGNIAFDHSFEKQYIINSTYPSFKAFFESEIQTLGEFGRKYTNKYNNPDSVDAKSQQRDSGGTYGTGYGFDEEGKAFYVNPWRAGTNSRNITTTIKIEIIYSDGTLIFETEADDLNSEIFYETEQVFDIVDGKHMGNVRNQTEDTSAIIDLNFFNCFTQGNGAESYKYKDAFNANALNIDIRPTSTITETYKEIQRISDITYSEPYVENNGLNGLNEFNLARVNYKDDVLKHFGQIMHMTEEGTDLLIFQEDRVSKVLVGKQMINSADGEGTLTTTTSVLGEQIPYAGTYGTLHAESVAIDANDIYFVDVKRGAVCKKGLEGITEISDTGMHNYFRNNLPLYINSPIYGGFDPLYNEYIISMPQGENIIRENLDCSEVKTYTNYEGAVILNTILQNTLGDFIVNVNSNNPVKVTIYDDSDILVYSKLNRYHNFNYNKVNYKIKYLKVIVETEEESTFDIMLNCPISKVKTITTLVYGDDLIAGSQININWYSYGNYSTPTKQYIVDMVEGQSLNNKLEGTTASSIIPPDNNILKMQYVSNDQYPIRWGQFEMKVLLSNREYTSSEIESLRDSSYKLTTDEVIKPNGDIVISAMMELGNYQYIYVIYECITKDVNLLAVDDEIEVNPLDTYLINVTANDTTYAGRARVEITTQPLYGNCYVDSNNHIIYTNVTASPSDTICYKLVYGNNESNVAKVMITFKDETIKCDASISASGNTGIYKLQMNYGTDAGEAGIAYDALNVPDKFIIENENGEILAQTKYKGSSNIILNNSEYTLPIYEYNVNTRLFEPTGEEEIITVDVEDVDLTGGQGVLLFNKEAGPLVATIKVIAPLGGTAWNLSGVCPITK